MAVGRGVGVDVRVVGVVMLAATGAMSGCLDGGYDGSVPTGPSAPKEEVRVAVDAGLVADALGDGDGYATIREFEALDNYFDEYVQAWFLTAGIPIVYSQRKEIPASALRDHFTTHRRHGGVYPGEPELRAAYEGCGIRGRVAVLVITWELAYDARQYFIIDCYSTGGYISTETWTRVKIVAD